MLELAKNIAKGKNLVESYEIIYKFLEILRKEPEQRYTLESLCRIAPNPEYKEQKIKQIRDLKARKANNSYEAYQCQTGAIDHEFPIDIDNKSQEKLILLVDRFIAMMHILLVMKPSEIIETQQIIRLADDLCDKLTKLINNCCDKGFTEHINALINAGKYAAAGNLKTFDNPDILKFAIKYGYKEQKIYIKILNNLLNNGKNKEALTFYNEDYVSAFNQASCKSVSKLRKILAEKA